MAVLADQVERSIMFKSIVFPSFPVGDKRALAGTTEVPVTVDSLERDLELVGLWRRVFPEIVKVLGSPTKLSGLHSIDIDPPSHKEGVNALQQVELRSGPHLQAIRATGADR